MSYGILFDSVRCRQCGGCVDACKVKWDLPDRDPDKLSENTFTTLEIHDGHPVRRMCMHCENPACVSVCPVRALEKTPEGPVIYHADRCMGCRYCVIACPFSIPKYEWSSAVPRVRKCVMCHDRVSRGKKPACTLFCPYGGIQSGPREEMLAEAKRRLAEEPDKYHQHVYGEREAGGTGVLVIGAVPPERLGLPVNVGDDPLPEKTWAALSRLPGVVGVAGAFSLAFWWVVRRRDQVRAEEAAAFAEREEKARARVTRREKQEVNS
ncbi:MAG: 4Fe-4S dicluster domain-containing protein [Planctomycetes bacterium]|jgi:formate dehydrogenase iron-sulfur subunit|nr:4Fe-4S dicluster domain-containing protein [Planctomycetota bacterium]